MGAEGTEIFDFDNPRSLEKALSGKELHRKLLLLLRNVEEILFGQIFLGPQYRTNGIKTRLGLPVIWYVYLYSNSNFLLKVRKRTIYFVLRNLHIRNRDRNFYQ